MNSLSISNAWNEASSFVKANFGSLFTIAFALIALPSVALQALAVGAGGEPSGGLLVSLLMLFVMVMSVVGTLALSALALGRENIIGRAIALGFRRFLTVFAATLLIVLAAVLALIPLILLLGIQPEDMETANVAAAGRITLATFLFLAIFIILWVRFMLVTPAAAAETGGPLAVLRRSWQLTAGYFWKLLGFALLFVIAAVIAIFAVSALLGILIALLAGPPEPGTLSSLLVLLLGGVFNALFVIYFTATVARIYLQLAGASTSGT